MAKFFTKNLRDAHCTDIYVVSGREPQDATWAPRFVYHGFRYVEISGYPNAKTEDFTAEVVDDEMAHTGTFTCSDETLNQVLRNAFWGIRSNYKGMPVDCRNATNANLGWETTRWVPGVKAYFSTIMPYTTNGHVIFVKHSVRTAASRM